MTGRADRGRLRDQPHAPETSAGPAPPERRGRPDDPGERPGAPETLRERRDLLPDSHPSSPRYRDGRLAAAPRLADRELPGAGPRPAEDARRPAEPGPARDAGRRDGGGRGRGVGQPEDAARLGDTGQEGDTVQGGDLPLLDDRAYAARTRLVEARLREAHRQGLSTDQLHTRDPDRKIWTRERDDTHETLVDDLYESAAQIPCEGKAIIAGGLGGAGKSTVLAGPAGIDRSRYLTINPDDIKEKLAERGMTPQVEGLSPMECSHLAHEESSHIAKRLSERAYSERKNVIWDITMSSRASVQRRIDDLRQAGYQHIAAVFVDIPVEVSVARALARHRDGLERHRRGEGQGGRYVPPEIIRQQRTPDGGTVNREVFDALRDRFDRWSVYDNGVDGRAPVRTESSETDREHP